MLDMCSTGLVNTQPGPDFDNGSNSIIFEIIVSLAALPESVKNMEYSGYALAGMFVKRNKFTNNLPQISTI